MINNNNGDDNNLTADLWELKSYFLLYSVSCARSPSAHLRGSHLAAQTLHLTGFQRGTTWPPAGIDTPWFGGRPPVKMREARLFKSWADSQSRQQLKPQDPLILGSWSVTLSVAVCSFQWINGVHFFLLNSLISDGGFKRWMMWPCEVKRWEHVVGSI